MKRQVLQMIGVAAGPFFLCIAIAQPSDIPPIGTIDFYGLRTISETEVLELLPFKEGDTLTPDDLPESFIESLSSDVAESLGISRVEFNFGCCGESGLSQIYIGIEETPGPRVVYREAPAGDSTLPPEILTSYEEFGDRWVEAVLSGNAREDRSEGHSLMDYPPLRAIQERFLVYAEQYREILIQVLHESADAEHRGAAAWVLGYAQDKASVTADLTQAVLDPDGGVRNNATRALAIIAVYAKDKPELGIEFRTDPFIDMLNSIVWSDRNKGLAVLDPLTEARDPQLLRELQERTLLSLIDMCRWKEWGHASAACLILQRIADLPEQPEPGSRERTIARAIELLPDA